MVVEAIRTAISERRCGEAQDLLDSAKPTSPEEHAEILYYRAHMAWSGRSVVEASAVAHQLEALLTATPATASGVQRVGHTALAYCRLLEGRTVEAMKNARFKRAAWAEYGRLCLADGETTGTQGLARALTPADPRDCTAVSTALQSIGALCQSDPCAAARVLLTLANHLTAGQADVWA